MQQHTPYTTTYPLYNNIPPIQQHTPYHALSQLRSMCVVTVLKLKLMMQTLPL